MIGESVAFQETGQNKKKINRRNNILVIGL